MRDADGHVYFLIDEQARRLKAGWSASPKERAANLQTAHHARLDLIGSYPGSPAEESRVHEFLREFHVRGEWFEAHPDVLNWVYQGLALWGFPRTIDQELPRRCYHRRCYHRCGVRGLAVALVHRPTDEFQVTGSKWGPGRSLLVTVGDSAPAALAGPAECLPRPGGWALRVTCLADVRVRPARWIPAERVAVLEHWPVCCQW